MVQLIFLIFLLNLLTVRSLRPGILKCSSHQDELEYCGDVYYEQKNDDGFFFIQVREATTSGSSELEISGPVTLIMHTLDRNSCDDSHFEISGQTACGFPGDRFDLPEGTHSVFWKTQKSNQTDILILGSVPPGSAFCESGCGDVEIQNEYPNHNSVISDGPGRYNAVVNSRIRVQGPAMISFEELDLPIDCSDFLLVHDDGGPSKICGSVAPPPFLLVAQTEYFVDWHTGGEHNNAHEGFRFSTQQLPGGFFNMGDFSVRGNIISDGGEDGEVARNRDLGRRRWAALIGGPANLIFDSLDMYGPDMLSINGVPIWGTLLPKPIVLGSGTHRLLFSSDTHNSNRPKFQFKIVPDDSALHGGNTPSESDDRTAVVENTEEWQPAVETRFTGTTGVFDTGATGDLDTGTASVFDTTTADNFDTGFDTTTIFTESTIRSSTASCETTVSTMIISRDDLPVGVGVIIAGAIGGALLIGAASGVWWMKTVAESANVPVDETFHEDEGGGFGEDDEEEYDDYYDDDYDDEIRELELGWRMHG